MKIFLSVFVLFFCVCVCVWCFFHFLFVCVTREREERWIERSADIRAFFFSSLCRTLRLLTLSLVYICMNIRYRPFANQADLLNQTDQEDSEVKKKKKEKTEKINAIRFKINTFTSARNKEMGENP